jgi:hypothetical protein
MGRPTRVLAAYSSSKVIVIAHFVVFTCPLPHISSAQSFQSVARRRTKGVQRNSGIQLNQLAPRYSFNVHESLHPFPVEQGLRVGAFEGLDHSISYIARRYAKSSPCLALERSNVCPQRQSPQPLLFTFSRNRHGGCVRCRAFVRPCLLLSRHSYGCWVYSYNSPRSVACEISCVESKDMSYVVDNHSGGDTSIVDLDA